MAHQASKVSHSDPSETVSYTVQQSDPPRKPRRPVLKLEIPRAKFNAIQAELATYEVPPRSVSALAALRILSGHFELVPA